MRVLINCDVTFGRKTKRHSLWRAVTMNKKMTLLCIMGRAGISNRSKPETYLWPEQSKSTPLSNSAAAGLSAGVVIAFA